MSEANVPKIPKGAFRIVLELASPRPRIDQVLLDELRKQNQSIDLRAISRAKLKELFKNKRVRIKGQAAVPSSSLAKGTTYVDILGYGAEEGAEEGTEEAGEDEAEDQG
jgi:hypothetical protein